MDIVKIANEWARDEILSSKLFILFGVLFAITAAGCWQLGKTDLAKAYIFPSLTVGLLLLMAGVGFLVNNKTRLSNFEKDYQSDPTTFITSEIARAEKTMGEYENVAFKVFPVVIIVAALLFIFINTPLWRAISVCVIAFMTVALLLDSHAHARMKNYHEQLILEEKK